jgi:hypothetical protein
MPSMVEPARVSRQEMRSAVNFGVVALARATGTSRQMPLTLRCECGGAACMTTVSISTADYESAMSACHLLVSPEHRNGARAIVGSLEWAIVEA